MKRSIFLEDENAIWLKGNLHSHSTFSDGALTPEKMKEAYQDHGYDFLAVTDHDTYTDTRILSEETFTMLQGFELWANASTDKSIHINFLWDDKLEGIESGQKLHLPERTGKETRAFCYQMRKKGSYVQLNHPVWSLLETNEVEDNNPFDAIEVVNYGNEWLKDMRSGSVFWSEMLSRGCRLWNGGGDDNHNRQGSDSLYHDSFGGFTVVKASNRSPKAILTALKTGSFYSSMGPSIYDFYVEDDEVHVVCSPCMRILMNGQEMEVPCQQTQVRYMTELPCQQIQGRKATELVTRLKGTEKLVRVECIDEAGYSAYSNPIYLD